jgi:hypothetical protein
MGKMINILSLFVTINFFSQEKKVVVVFHDSDSVFVEKMQRDYMIYIYNKENIAYNKKNGLLLMKNMYDPSYKYCKECKKELEIAIIGSPRKRICGKKEEMPAKIWMKANSIYDINMRKSVNYFYVQGKYYKFIGEVQID